jgi:zona occludens toxin
MPIRLVTGLPGHGKTLYTLQSVRDQAARESRPVFQSGIKGLKLPWQEWKPEEWEQLPANSIFVIDEAQFPFPVRGRGEPPEWIGRLSVHRHLGIDFVLITQDPMLLDNHVRRLVDQHMHVVRKFGTHWATIHEFANGVKQNVSQSRAGSIRHEWKYPKDVFDLYQSAELHTVKSRVPARVWILLSVPVIFGGLVWYAYHRLNPEASGKRLRDQIGGPGAPGQSLPGGMRPGGGQVATMSTAEYLKANVPRVPGLAYTAPIFDEVTKPNEAPVPAACVSNKSRCKCYSQQATPLEMPEQLCRDIVAGGVFVAFKNGDREARRGAYLTDASFPARGATPGAPAGLVGFGSGYGMAARRMDPGGVSAGDGEASPAPPGRRAPGRAPGG